METKSKKPIIILICIFVVLVIFVCWYFILNSNNQNNYTENIKNQNLNINISENIEQEDKEENVDYYARSCFFPKIEVLKDGVWEKAGRVLLPGKGQYILDGEYVPYTLCDYVMCEPFSEVVTPKYNYAFVGIEDVSHIQKRFDNTEAPAYVSKELEGMVRVTTTVYTDNLCKNKKVLENYFDF